MENKILIAGCGNRGVVGQMKEMTSEQLTELSKVKCQPEDTAVVIPKAIDGMTILAVSNTNDTGVRLSIKDFRVATEEEVHGIFKGTDEDWLFDIARFPKRNNKRVRACRNNK